MGNAKAQGRNEKQAGDSRLRGNDVMGAGMAGWRAGNDGTRVGMLGMAGMTGNDREWQAWTGVGGRRVSGLRETHGRTGNGILARALWGELTLTVIRAWDTIRYGRGTARAAGSGRRGDVFPANEGTLEAMRRAAMVARKRAAAVVRAFLGWGSIRGGCANDNVEYAVDGQTRSRGRLAARGSRSVDGGDVAATRFRARSSAGAL